MHVRLLLGVLFVGLLGCATTHPTRSSPTSPGDQLVGTSDAPPEEESHDPSTRAVPPSSPKTVQVPRVVVARPPFRYGLLRPAERAPEDALPLLAKKSESKNRITDDEEWFRAHGLALPTIEVPEGQCACKGGPFASIATGEGTYGLVLALDHGDHAIGLYGERGEARFVAVFGADRQLERVFDFASFLEPERFVESDRDYVRAKIAWAQRAGSTLYVSSYHPTYAKSSYGVNGFITAVDASTGSLVWQSEPLVANATNFVLWNGFVLTGYGFTAEPDHLFVLDGQTGETRRKIRLRSGPSYLIARDDRLYVRTYDTDYVFDLGR